MEFLGIFLFEVLVLVSFVNAQVSNEPLTGYKKEVASGLDVSTSISQTLWPTSPTNLQNCALLCNSQQNCMLFSVTNLPSGSTVCKTSFFRNQTQASNGSQLYYKILVDKDGFSTFLDPFRYKLTYTPVTSAEDAAEICESMGALLPVAFPSQTAYQTLRTFMPTRGSIFLGITLTGINNITGNLSFITRRDWNFQANPSIPDPNQPWLPGEPKLPQNYDDLSDIQVMMTSDGWFTVNTASGDVQTSNVICIRHTTYEIVDVAQKFYRFQKTPTANWMLAASTCKSEGAYLAVLLGREGGQVLKNYESWGTLFWLGGFRPNSTVNRWVFEDGSVVDATSVSNRWIDTRQLWFDTAFPSATSAANCMQEYLNSWANGDCSGSEDFLCQGGF